MTLTPMFPPPALVAGRYEVLEPLGRGGMSEVYLARQVNVGNKVAVKFLATDLGSDESFVRRFNQETRISLEMTHPGVAQLLDAGTTDDGRLFIVFEYVEGQDLRKVLQNGALAFDEARDIALRVAEALAFAHSRGVVHRDIKPENIRVRRDLGGVYVKVLDFGIAQLELEAAARLTQEGALAGTPRYMSPEQVEARPVDHRADQYALGLTFFEMLAGRPAFGAPIPAALMMQQLRDPVPPLSSIIPIASEQIDALLAIACAKSPDQRFPDMAAMALAIKRLDRPTALARRPEPAPTPQLIDDDALMTLAQPAAEPVPDTFRAVVPETSSRAAQSLPDEPSPAPPRRGRTVLIAGLALVVLAGLGAVVAPRLMKQPPRVALVVNSAPDGAIVTIDREAVGTTPWGGFVRADQSHAVHVELSGYQPWDRTIDAGVNTVDAMLTKKH